MDFLKYFAKNNTNIISKVLRKIYLWNKSNGHITCGLAYEHDNKLSTSGGFDFNEKWQGLQKH